MKRKFCLIIITLLISNVLFADLIDQPIATIFLTKNEFVTSMQLQNKIDQVQLLAQQSGLDLSTITRKKILETLIDEILISQAASRDGMAISDNELKSLLDANKKNVEQQLNQKISDEQFQQIINQQAGMTWNEYSISIKNQVLQQRYIVQVKKDMLENIEEPSAAEIQTSYDNNAQNLVNPKYVKLSHILVSTLNLNAADKQKALENISKIYNIFKNGTNTFEKLASEHSEDTQTKYQGGNIGFVPINDPNLKKTFGESVFGTIFSMKKGEVKGVLETSLGYHIFKVTDITAPKMLTLDDKIRPDATVTVREYIKAGLYQEMQQRMLQKAVLEVIDELRADADIKILDAELR